jgi:RsiW-degrading membrane proteinase PrsW (M82 family)
VALSASLLLAFVPALLMATVVYWLDRYEKEPLILLGAAFFWGAVVAAGGAYVINTVLGIGVFSATGSGEAAAQATASLLAPIVEEGLKGAALLIVFLAFRAEFDSILDGIIYAGITALGFAATENAQYIYQRGYLEGGWAGFWQLVFIRDVVVAWQHPFFTAFIGFASSVSSHAFHNTFALLIGGLEGFALGSIMDWTGWLVMAIFVIFMIDRERGLLKRQLRDEIAGGIISAAQYEKALSPVTMSTAFLTGGRNAARFYQLCGELAHKKEQFMRFGDEQGNTATVKLLRSQLAALSRQVR